MIRLPFVMNIILCAYCMIQELPESMFIGLFFFVLGEQIVLNLFLVYFYMKKTPRPTFFDLFGKYILYLISIVWIVTIALYLFARELIIAYPSVDDLVILILAIGALWIVYSIHLERVVSVLLNRSSKHSFERIDLFMVSPTIFAPRVLNEIYDDMKND